MKKLLIIAMATLPILLLIGCGSDKDALITIEDGQTQMMEISEQLMNWEISQEDANEKMEEITANMETQEDMMKDLYKNVSDFDGLPKWAKNLGIYELKWFDFLDSKSSVTDYDKKSGMGESIALIYAYDDEAEAIQSAEKLAKAIGITESNHSPRILQKNLDETMKSMMEYMSQEEKMDYEKNKMSGYIADDIKWDYSIMVSILQGEISILATNISQIGN